jgi:hypothetical protein
LTYEDAHVVAKYLAEATAIAIIDVYTVCFGNPKIACDGGKYIDETAHAVSKVLSLHLAAELSGPGGRPLPPLLYLLS